MNDRHDRFFAFIREKLEGIDTLDSEALRTHRKVLYVAFIDSLSAIVFPAYLHNRERFTAFVAQFGNWPDAGRISTPHLARALALNPDPAYNTVRALVSQSFGKWSPGALVPLSQDLEAGVVGTHWPRGKNYERAVQGASWEHFKHAELLYAYRNSLVHGFRGLGLGHELSEDQEPYYLSSHDATPDAPSKLPHWELIYPVAFLSSLAQSSLVAVESHLRANRIDPVEVLRSGRFWVRALNR
jgi:hypothetical protein